MARSDPDEVSGPGVPDTLADMQTGAGAFLGQLGRGDPNVQQSPRADIIHGLSDDRPLDFSVEDMRDAQDALGLDPETMEPGYRYRWAQVRVQNMTRRKLRGYETVLRSKDKVRPLYDEDDGAAEDAIRRGDTVLMKIRDHRLDKNLLYNERVGRLRIKSSAQRFKDKAAQSRTSSGEAVRVFEQDRLRGEPGE